MKGEKVVYGLFEKRFKCRPDLKDEAKYPCENRKKGVNFFWKALLDLQM